jgi:hypothetical protein
LCEADTRDVIKSHAGLADRLLDETNDPSSVVIGDIFRKKALTRRRNESMPEIREDLHGLRKRAFRCVLVVGVSAVVRGWRRRRRMEDHANTNFVGRAFEAQSDRHVGLAVVVVSEDLKSTI